MNKNKGLVFNIQKYSVHDGPGIRSIVFFKGCPLACKWCSNPEGMAVQPEISYKKNKCIGMSKCAYCAKTCTQDAIIADKEDKAFINRKKCNSCLECAEACPAKAMEQMGRWMTVEEILAEVSADETFYKRSDGGITLSGGEPLLQADFVTRLLKQAHADGLETAIETTGCVPWEKARMVFQELDYIHMDIKTVDPVKHKQFTGQDNQLILENFAKLCAEFPEKPIVARTPVIPGFNDTLEELQAITDFINQVGQHAQNLKYELLPFHNFGSSKYEFQGKPYTFAGYKNMDKSFLENLRKQLKSEIPILEIR